MEFNNLKSFRYDLVMMWAFYALQPRVDLAKVRVNFLLGYSRS